MPKEEKLVDIDTSGEGAEINLEERRQPMKQLLKTVVSPMTHLQNLMSSQLFRIANLNKKQVKRNKKK